MPLVREVGSRLVGTLPTSATSLRVNSPPVSPRSQQMTKAPGDRRVTCSRLKSPMSKSTKMSSHLDGKGIVCCARICQTHLCVRCGVWGVGRGAYEKGEEQREAEKEENVGYQRK